MLLLADLNYTSSSFYKKSFALVAIQLLAIFASVVFRVLPDMVLFVCSLGFFYVKRKNRGGRGGTNAI